jgi:hypothetical protein
MLSQVAAEEGEDQTATMLAVPRQASCEPGTMVCWECGWWTARPARH